MERVTILAIATAALSTGLATGTEAWAQPAATLAQPAKAPAAEQPKKEAPKPEQPKAEGNIIAVLSKDAEFKTLVELIKLADLAKALEGAGPFTVFAPSNGAFAKLPAGTLDDLRKPENRAQLVSILKYHVIPSSVAAADVAKMKQSSLTLQGGTFMVEVREGSKVFVGNDPKAMARIFKTDIKASNGLVHGIDHVMIPSAPAAPAAPAKPAPGK